MGLPGEREVTAERDEVGVHELRREADLSGHAVDVLEVLGEDERHAVAVRTQVVAVGEGLLEVACHGVVERVARPEDGQERKHLLHQAVHLRTLEGGAGEERVADDDVVVAMEVRREPDGVEHEGARDAGGDQTDPQSPVVRGDELALVRGVVREPTPAFAQQYGDPAGHEGTGQEADQAPGHDVAARGVLDALDLRLRVVPQRDQVPPGLLVARDQPVPVRADVHAHVRAEEADVGVLGPDQRAAL